MIVSDELSDELAQVAFAQRYDMSQALTPYRADPALRERVEVNSRKARVYNGSRSMMGLSRTPSTASVRFRAVGCDAARFGDDWSRPSSAFSVAHAQRP